MLIQQMDWHIRRFAVNTSNIRVTPKVNAAIHLVFAITTMPLGKLNIEAQRQPPQREVKLYFQ